MGKPEKKKTSTLIILLECIKIWKHQIPQKHLYQILRKTMRIKKIQPQSFLQSPSRWMTSSKWRRPNHGPFLNIHQDEQQVPNEGGPLDPSFGVKGERRYSIKHCILSSTIDLNGIPSSPNNKNHLQSNSAREIENDSNRSIIIGLANKRKWHLKGWLFSTHRKNQPNNYHLFVQ